MRAFDRLDGLMTSLWNFDQQRDARLDLRALVAHMSIYFPFGENTLTAKDMKVS